MLMDNGSGFFFPELRSGEGLTREVEGEGEGVRFGRGELTRDWELVPGRIWVSDVGTERVGGGVLADTRPGILEGSGSRKEDPNKWEGGADE